MQQNQQLELIKRIKVLSDLGLLYSTNEFDKERYEELQRISMQFLSLVSDQPVEKLTDFFMPVKDYTTPKVDIRGFVLNEANEILFVKETVDGKWSIPGGWGDVGFSPAEVVVKEIKEETGLNAKAVRILALYDKKCHPHPPQPFYVYKVVFFCHAEKGELKAGFDIGDAKFFSINNLPELSEDRILKSQIEQLYKKVITNDESVYFD